MEHSSPHPIEDRAATDFAADVPDKFGEPLAIVDFVEDSGRSPCRWLEVLAVLLLVVVCDQTIYRGEGFAGYAVLFLAAPVLMFLGSSLRRRGLGLAVIGVMLLLAAGKLLWCGNGLLVAAGFVLLVAFSMALAGLRLFVFDLLVFASQTVPAGCAGLVHYGRSLSGLGTPRGPRVSWLNVALPLVVFVAFGAVFVLANPDLAEAFGEHIEALATAVREWIVEFAPSPAEILFWMAVLWISAGLLRPVMSRALLRESPPGKAQTTSETESAALSRMYPAFRNTLVTVIVLFAAYLLFEFTTLWFRVFPEGFYYSGYAHEGAAWLTLALAMATVVLSFIFRGGVLQDARLPKLRRLAWLWSVENVLLALAVYHRLLIYIGFNGMTRMRTVGMFGCTAVLIGFIVVLWKIARGRDFVWLIRRQLWTLAIIVYLFAITPVDSIVSSYNVRRILAGDPAPSVQISVHPISSEGVVLLTPLLDCDDETIREGIRALLADRHEAAIARHAGRTSWTSYQIVDEVLLDKLDAASDTWSAYADREVREAALTRFHEYAYQWY